jgi:hypothetical protein
MRLFVSYLYGYTAVLSQNKPVFADLLAQYMELTGDRFAILKGDHSPCSLDGESIAFCNLMGGPSRSDVSDLSRREIGVLTQVQIR